jgi:ribosomal subunit interface protein
MISDTQVLFRGLEPSPSVEEVVHKRVAKLERYSDEIQSLRVILEAPHNNHHKGKVYHVGVEALIPNHDIVVTHDQHDKHSHEDIYVAVRDAFNALERQLKAVYEKHEKQRRQNGRHADEEQPMLETGGENALSE